MTADGSPASGASLAPGAARCPRCAGEFHCGIDDPQPCACTTLRLGTAMLLDLRARYRGCLCLRCLAELADEQATGAAAGPPR